MRFRPEVLGVVESPLVQIATVAEGMPGSLKLCYGESDLPTPEFICRAADEASLAGHTFYTHTAGAPELREAIAAKVFELHGVTYRPSEIMSTVGASMAIFIADSRLRRPGRQRDRHLAGLRDLQQRRHHGRRRAAAGAADARGASIPPRPRSRARGHRPATRMLIVNSPSNPTGWLMTEDEQRALYDLAERHDLMILADEVYERLVFDGPIAPSFARVAQNSDRLIVVNSFSKTYNMTGWRLGWAQGSERTIRLMYKAAEFMTSNPAAMVQQAGIVALRDGESYVGELRDHYAKRRTQVMDALAAIPGVSLPEPQGAFYAFPRIDGLTDSTAFTADLLRGPASRSRRARLRRRRRGSRASVLRGDRADARDGARPVASVHGESRELILTQSRAC